MADIHPCCAIQGSICYCFHHVFFFFYGPLSLLLIDPIIHGRTTTHRESAYLTPGWASLRAAQRLTGKTGVGCIQYQICHSSQPLKDFSFQPGRNAIPDSVLRVCDWRSVRHRPVKPLNADNGSTLRSQSLSSAYPCLLMNV